MSTPIHHPAVPFGRLALIMLFVCSIIAAAAAEPEKAGQTSSAASTRPLVYTHASPALTYAIAPGWVTMMLGAVGLLTAGLMI